MSSQKLDELKAKFSTRLTKMLGVDYPILLAGMGGVSYAELVAAVSEAGGFGCMGAATIQDPESLRQEIRDVKKLTKKPFGVDLLSVGDLKPFVDVIVEEGTKAFVTGLGIPRDTIEYCHKHNVLVGVVVGRVAHAVSAVEAGVDFIIAQGTEAGGHTGEIALSALLPQVVDAVKGKIPVAAAGAIVQGRNLVSSFALGAEGVWMGTRFLASHEARTVPFYKEKLLKTASDGTIVTRCYTGKTCRVIRNKYVESWTARQHEILPFPQQIAVSVNLGANHIGQDSTAEGVNAEEEFMPCGQGVGAITEILPAAEIVKRTMLEADECLTQLNRRLAAKL